MMLFESVRALVPGTSPLTLAWIGNLISVVPVRGSPPRQLSLVQNCNVNSSCEGSFKQSINHENSSPFYKGNL
ncbi:hypothetical protein TNCV_4459511 [Trichonephila clavipes]|nr:hypothetical protein TNCV_4459511 [Trichonephila clavipes]